MTMFGICAMRGRATCPGPRAGIPAAALAGLLLAGCTSGHVGESWQCPLATGGSCASIAAADPAVPGAKAGRDMALGQPLWLLPRETKPEPGEKSPAPKKTPSCAGDCGFDPFGWLARLFAGSAEDKTAPATAGTMSSSVSPRDVEERPAESPAAALPAEPDAEDGDPGTGKPDDAALRTGEAVARIWIAPFVDADGIYREAAWVRVVLEPAGWRLR